MVEMIYIHIIGPLTTGNRIEEITSVSLKILSVLLHIGLQSFSVYRRTYNCQRWLLWWNFRQFQKIVKIVLFVFNLGIRRVVFSPILYCTWTGNSFWVCWKFHVYCVSVLCRVQSAMFLLSSWSAHSWKIVF